MAALAAGRPSPLDNDDAEPLGLSALELEEEEELVHVVGGLRLSLRGFPRDAGQTLACTGETTWRGGDILARHLWDARDASRSGGAVLEVGAGLQSASVTLEAPISVISKRIRLVLGPVIISARVLEIRTQTFLASTHTKSR